MTRFVFLRSRSSTQIPYTFEQHCMMKVYISLFVKQMAAIRPGTASCFFFFFLPSDQKNSRRKAVSPLFFLPLLYPLSIVHFLKSDYSVTNGRRRDCFHDFLLLPVTEQWTWSALTGENLTKNCSICSSRFPWRRRVGKKNVTRLDGSKRLQLLICL